MSNFRDKTIGHFHTDPKLILQDGCTLSLSIGQIVYLDDDGIYKPAIATSIKTSNVQGIVWSFIGNDSFYLKMTPGPLLYRFPYTKDFFGTDINGHVNANDPLLSKFPGLIGSRLYLSETVAGELQNTEPLIPVIIGYKTKFGMIYRPDLNYGFTCIPESSSSSSSEPEIIETGSMFDYAGTTSPDGYLLCDGSDVSRTTYADLFAILGTSFGIGDGSLTFTLPDCRGRSTIGVGIGTYSGINTSRSINDIGGTEIHTLTLSEFPVHNHGFSVGSLAATNLGSGSTVGVNTATTRGSGGPHENMHPYIALNKIIKT